MAKRVLILGGTSFFGKTIARNFAASGYEVTLFTRGSAKPSDLPPHKSLTGDRNSAKDLLAAAKAGPWDVVIDNIAYTEEHGRLANEAFADVGRYVLCSTVSVYRFCRNPYPHPIEEDSVDYDYCPPKEDPTDVHWKYARGKMELERLIAEKNRLPWTFVRPPVVYGPFDPTQRGFWYLSRLLDGGPVLLADGGKQTFRLVSADDCAQVFLPAAEKQIALRRAYNVGQREIITLRSFLDESAAALGVKPEFLSVPGEFLGEKWSGAYAPMAPFAASIERAKSELGYSPTPFAEWARSSALWFRDQFQTAGSKLLEGREEEVEFAARWKAATGPFSTH